MGPAALCTADRLLMVFVSHRPVPVQGADSPGCYIKELWVCRGSVAASRTHKLSWNYPGDEIYMGTVALLILAKPIISAPLLRRRGGGRGGGGRSGKGLR